MALRTTRRAEFTTNGTPKSIHGVIESLVKAGEMPEDARILDVQINSYDDIGLAAKYRQTTTTLTFTVEWDD